MANIFFPSNFVWAFTPTYIKITNATSATKVTVSIGSNSVEASIYNGRADILINRLVQLCFNSPKTERSKRIYISVSGDVSGSASVVAIWGCLQFGDTYGQVANSQGVRRVQYFTHFPFAVDVLTSSGIETRSAGRTITTTTSLGTVTTVIEDRSETEGIYLRWIDRFGFMQYYLFVPANVEIKNTPAQYSIEEMTAIRDMAYARHNRPLHVEEQRTMKLSAVNLDADTLAYVSTIIGSAMVDMWLSDGSWLPVTITSGTYNYSQHHLKQLQDLEISIELPKQNSQSL